MSSLAPQLKVHRHDDNLGLSKDPQLDLIFENGVFYQDGIDGTKVGIIFDRAEMPPLPINIVANPRLTRRG